MERLRTAWTWKTEGPEIFCQHTSQDKDRFNKTPFKLILMRHFDKGPEICVHTFARYSWVLHRDQPIGYQWSFLFFQLFWVSQTLHIQQNFRAVHGAKTILHQTSCHHLCVERAHVLHEMNICKKVPRFQQLLPYCTHCNLILQLLFKIIPCFRFILATSLARQLITISVLSMRSGTWNISWNIPTHYIVKSVWNKFQTKLKLSSFFCRNWQSLRLRLQMTFSRSRWRSSPSSFTDQWQLLFLKVGNSKWVQSPKSPKTTKKRDKTTQIWREVAAVTQSHRASKRVEPRGPRKCKKNSCAFRWIPETHRTDPCVLPCFTSHT